MAKKEHIDVKVSIESIRDSLRKRIVSENSALMTNVIIGCLEQTDIGLELLFKAMSGVQDKLKYKVGDIVMVPIDTLYSWNFDKSQTEEAGMVIQGRMKAQITDVNPFKKYAYKLSYEAMQTGSIKVMTAELSDSSLCLEDEWPGDEKKKPDDDLPF